MKNQIKREEGQSLVLIALLMVTIVGFMGLLLDGGRVFAARRQSQNAADAAAFAAETELLKPSCTPVAEDYCIRQVIVKYAQANGIANPEDVVGYYMRKSDTVENPGQIIGYYNIVQAGATGILVKATIHTQPFLISVLTGGGPVDTMSLAIMRSGLLTNFNGAEPMTVWVGALAYNVPIQLMGGTTGSGSFQWLNYDPNCNVPNAGALAAAILNPPTNMPKAADPSGNWLVPSTDYTVNNLIHYFCSTTGTSGANEVDAALRYWLTQVPEDKRHWIIPVYDYICKHDDTQPCGGGGTGSNLVYHIIAFAEFVPQGYYLSASHSYNMTPQQCPGTNQCVIGYFQGFSTLGHGDAGQDCNPNDGCAIWLDQ